MAEVRLQKYLAEAGVDSRRKCEQLIEEGVVRVNGKIVDTLPAFVDPDKDDVKVNNKRVHRSPKVYYLLNKPKGVLCTNKDPHGRPIAIQYVPPEERVFCVGRLDADTTGLVILTNDNELANKLTHPRYGVPKTYIAQVKGTIDGKTIEKIKKGVWLSEGKTNKSAVKVLHKGHDNSAIEITIKQGLNRQIRRMLAKEDFKVKSLKRIKIGPINDKGIGIGKFRNLNKKEVSMLRKIAESDNKKGRNKNNNRRKRQK